jgi:hypothetical protein
MVIRALQQAIARAFTGDPGDPSLIDHVPVVSERDWREEKLAQAAAKYGKPFRCAADGLPREVFKDCKFTVTRPLASVTPLEKAPKRRAGKS